MGLMNQPSADFVANGHRKVLYAGGRGVEDYLSVVSSGRDVNCTLQLGGLASRYERALLTWDGDRRDSNRRPLGRQRAVDGSDLHGDGLAYRLGRSHAHQPAPRGGCAK